MTLKIIKYYIILLVIFFSFTNLAYANLEITEINNPTASTNRWIKVYNNDPNNNNKVNLTEWRIRYDDGGTWRYHTINAYGSPTLDSNSYAIIASSTSKEIEAFKTKNPDLSGISLFYGSLTFEKEGTEGTMGLSNIEADKEAIIVIGKMTYDGNNKSSNTNSSDNIIIDTENTTSSSSTSSTSSTPKEIPVIYKIATKIIAPKIVTAGVPFSIDHTTTGLNKEKIILGKFVWNFGDGMQKQLSVSDPFSYVYDYPGEYVLTLSYYDSIFDINPDATDRLTIKVIPSGVVISSVGSYADPFVEIENNSSYEMSLNKWILKGNVHSFVIPEGMVILPNKKLKFSPKITGFDFNDLSSISIIDTLGQVFATYPTKKTYSGNYYSSNNSQGNIVKADIVTSDQVAGIANSPDVINLNDLGASALNTDSGLNNKTLIYLGLAGIIAIGLLSIFLIRRKNEIPDYVEKGISASDMTIIE